MTFSISDSRGGGMVFVCHTNSEKAKNFLLIFYIQGSIAWSGEGLIVLFLNPDPQAMIVRKMQLPHYIQPIISVKHESYHYYLPRHFVMNPPSARYWLAPSTQDVSHG